MLSKAATSSSLKMLERQLSYGKVSVYDLNQEGFPNEMSLEFKKAVSLQKL
jgi:hypothetical protein